MGTVGRGRRRLDLSSRGGSRSLEASPASRELPGACRGRWAGPGRGQEVPEGSGSGFAAALDVLLLWNAVAVFGARPEGAAAVVATSGTGEWLWVADWRGGSHPRGGCVRSLGGAVLGMAGGAAGRMRLRGSDSRATGPVTLPQAVGPVPPLRLSDPGTCCRGPILRRSRAEAGVRALGSVCHGDGGERRPGTVSLSRTRPESVA